MHENSRHSDGHIEKAQYLADGDSDGDGGDNDNDGAGMQQDKSINRWLEFHRKRCDRLNRMRWGMEEEVTNSAWRNMEQVLGGSKF